MSWSGAGQVRLGHVSVSVSGPLLSLHILFLHQCLNATLDHLDVRCETRPHLSYSLQQKILELTEATAHRPYLLYELIVLQHFPSLHDTNNGCLDVQFPIFSHIIHCLLYFLKIRT